MKNLLKTMVIGLLLFGILVPYHYVTYKIIPLQIVNQETTIVANLKLLGAPDKHIDSISSAILMASKQTGVSDRLIIALMYTESEFNKNAKSSLNYMGLMQIPWDVKYTDANVLIGARIFKDKMMITNGDVKKAICLYKGWPVTDKKGNAQAERVLKIYNRLT